LYLFEGRWLRGQDAGVDGITASLRVTLSLPPVAMVRAAATGSIHVNNSFPVQCQSPEQRILLKICSDLRMPGDFLFV
jgi:hypothetical protein